MEQGLKALMQMIRCALLEQSQPLPEGLKLEDLYVLINKHQIQTLVYDGAVRCGVDRQHPVMRTLMQDYCRFMTVAELQQQHLEALYSAFDMASIEYMPLKGCVLRPLYPKAEMRRMHDADILIRMEQYDQIVPILERLGYTLKVTSNHEVIWKTHGLYLELHKRLFPSYSATFHAYFGDGWNLAKQKCGTRYSMETEEQFLYLFTHFAKHYREGSVGIRHMTDLWYYRIKHPQMDEVRIREVLQKISLEEFYDNILQTLHYWFEDGELTPAAKLVTELVVSGGSMGTEEMRELADGLRKAKGGSVRKNRVKDLVFPSVGSMRYRYGILEKHPYLLPVMWIHRWGRILLSEREKIDLQVGRLKMLEEEKLDAFEQSVRAVGLTFEFEEE